MPNAEPKKGIDAATANFVIVGGGPVGFLSALAIHRATGGSRPIVVYEGRHNLEQRLEESYPIGISHRGLRAVNEFSPAAADVIRQTGVIVDSWDIFAGSRQVAQVPSGVTRGHTRHGVVVSLFNQVQELGIQVLFGHRVSGLDLAKRTLSIAVADTGEEVVVDCSSSIVIAADGYNSKVRRLIIPNAPPVVPRTTPRCAVTPWTVNFRVLVMDAVQDALTDVPLNHRSHLIFNGTYCALIGSPGNWKWVAVPSAKKDDPAKDWFFIESDTPPVEAVEKLRSHLRQAIPPLADTEKYFTDEELRGFFSRKIFTGGIVSLSPLHFPHAKENIPWIVFLGDSAHSVYPATGEGLNSGLDDVYVFSKKVLEPSYTAATSAEPAPPLDLTAYTAERQEDVDALTSLAEEIISGQIGPPTVRATNLITMIVAALGRKFGLLGPSEAELRYGPESEKTLLPYREVLRRHVRQTGLIRSVAGIIVNFFSLFMRAPRNKEKVN